MKERNKKKKNKAYETEHYEGAQSMKEIEEWMRTKIKEYWINDNGESKRTEYERDLRDSIQGKKTEYKTVDIKRE